MAPQHRMCNACQLSHTHGLASSAFARHYSRNHGCFLFLWVLRCFTSPRSLQQPYVFRLRSPDMTPVFRGFPIRRSMDHSSFTSSPWLIAGYNVLHRLLVPRHPPIALSSLLFYKDARVHCVVLKIRAEPEPQPTRRPARSLARREDRRLRNRPLRTQQRALTPTTNHHPFHTHPEERAVLDMTTSA